MKWYDSPNKVICTEIGVNLLVGKSHQYLPRASLTRTVLTSEREELNIPHLSDAPTRSGAQMKTRGRHRRSRELADPKNASAAHR